MIKEFASRHWSVSPKTHSVNDPGFMSTYNEISPSAFQKIRDYVHRTAGIVIGKDKTALVTGRLWRRLELHGHKTYEAYFAYISSPEGAQERNTMLDLLIFSANQPILNFCAMKLSRNLMVGGCASGAPPHLLVKSRTVSPWCWPILWVVRIGKFWRRIFQAKCWIMRARVCIAQNALTIFPPRI
jgi:hypothetical protein